MTPPNKPEGKPKRRKAKFKVGQIVKVARKWEGFRGSNEHKFGKIYKRTSSRIYFICGWKGPWPEQLLRPLTKKGGGE